MKQPFQNIDELEVSNKTVLVRADLNVPFANSQVTDATRIERFVPTVQTLLEKNASVMICSHFGRPKGQVVDKYSLGQIVETLSEKLGKPVQFVKDCVGQEVQAKVKALQAGQVLLLENLRFHAEEEQNDPKFAKQLADLADVYLNDAFSCSHRAHASVEAITQFLPSGAGLLMEQELNALHQALENPKKPVLAIASGAKVSTKLTVLKNLAKKVDYLVLGGGMANTALYAKGLAVGASLCEKDMTDTFNELAKELEEAQCQLILPVDAIIAKELKAGVKTQVVDVNAVPDDYMILDIGPQTIASIKQYFQKSQTIVWNGPMGVFEVQGFEQGTLQLAKEAARLTKTGALLTVAGGGDTVAALAMLDQDENFSYVSSAGGAFLEWMEGKELPGVKALLPNST